MAVATTVELSAELRSAIRVTADPEVTRELNQNFGRALGAPAVLVTQLTDPRSAFHRLRSPLPVAPEMEERMAEGRRLHDLIEQRVAAPEHREVRVARRGIIGQMDLFLDRPIELKTTGSPVPRERLVADRPEYVEQLAMYCALTDRSEGALALVTDRAPGPRVRAFDVRFADLAEVRRRTEERAVRFRAALATDDVGRLPRCAWFDHGCAFRSGGVCACTGSESAEALPLAPLVASVAEDPRLSEQIESALAGDPEGSAADRVRSYRELVYLRRTYFERTAPSPAALPGTPAPEAPAPWDGPSMYQLLREAVESGPTGDVAQAVADGSAPEERVTLFRGAPSILKTSRARRASGAPELVDRSPWYFLELGLRCAAFDRPEGWLLVGYENLPPSGDPVRALRVRFEPLDPWRAELDRRTRRLAAALDAGTPDILPGCPEWMRPDCPHRAQCGAGEPCRIQR